MRTDLLDPKERHIEGRLVRSVERNGGIAWKFSSPQNASVPDRIVILNGWIAFVELKKPGGKLTEKQEAKAALLRDLGIHCWLITTYIEVDFFVDLHMVHPGPYAKTTVPTATLELVARQAGRR